MKHSFCFLSGYAYSRNACSPVETRWLDTMCVFIVLKCKRHVNNICAEKYIKTLPLGIRFVSTNFAEIDCDEDATFRYLSY